LTINPVYENKKAPCFSQDVNGQTGCPALNDIPGFLYAISQKNFQLAFEILKLTNPFSGGCGRFCDHPCETACNRDKFDSAVNIKDLERFISDYGYNNNLIPEAVPVTINKSAAIIGAGPAGLTCAFFLKQKGFKVDVFEKEKFAGGMMTQGIPVFRYPTEIMQWEINYIRSLGVNIFTDKKINKDELLNLYAKYDYVVLATGAHKSRKLNIPGEDNKAVITGLEFLKQINLNEHFRKTNGDFSQIDLNIGEKIAVIGGGYTAIDVARTASRMGKHVTIYYRRSEKDMDIHRGEVEECIKEGINFEYYLNPFEIIDNSKTDGMLTLKLEKMISGEVGSDGKSSIIPSGEFNEVLVHNVIKAIGETPDLKFLPEEYTIYNNKVEIKDFAKPMFMAGDARYGYARDVGMVVRAIGSGRNTAGDILEDLSKEKTTWYKENKIAYFHTIKARYFKRQARLQSNIVKSSLLKNSFAEIILPINEHEAIYAASRCFYCGICIQCDWCHHYSHGAIAKVEKAWTGSRNTRYFKFIENKVSINTREAVEACPRNAMGFTDITILPENSEVFQQYIYEHDHNKHNLSKADPTASTKDKINGKSKKKGKNDN